MLVQKHGTLRGLSKHAPEDAEIIKVTAQQWFWSFEHEEWYEGSG